MGLLMGALGGLGKAASEIADSHIQTEQRNKAADYDAMLREREARTRAELQKEYEREKDRYLNSPEYLAMLARTDEAKATNALTTRETLAPRAAGVAAKEFELGKGRRDAETAEKIENESKAGKQKTKDSIEADIARNTNPQYLAGVRNEARARHIESAGSMAQAALAKLQLQGAQQTQALRQQLAAARAAGDDTAVQSLQQQITDLAFTGKDTAAAYRTYSTASAKLIDLEMKLANADPTQAASIKAEIDEARLMQKQAAKDLGVKLPDAKATPDAPFSVGTVKNGYAYQGGDPRDQKNWKEVKAPASTSAAPAPSGPPVDRLRDQPIGMLTPLATIEESARAGNQKAIAYLQRRAQGMAENAAAPRTTADMLNR